MSDAPPLVLIGRNDLLSRFDSISRQFRDGGSCYVRVVGEAGCGKSAFLQACGSRAAQTDWEVLSGQCTEETFANPYGPFLTMLGLCFDRNGKLINDRSVHSIVDQISLDDISNAVQDIPGGTMLVFGIKVGMTFFESRRRPESSDELMNRNFEFILQVLQQIERKRKKPILLAIDDLHLASPTTCSLIEYLLTRGEDLRLLVISTWQAGSPRQSPQVAGFSQPEWEIHLPPLSDREMRQLLAGIYPQPLNESLVATLLELGRGLPKLLVESVRLVQASGVENLAEGANATRSAIQALVDRQMAQLTGEQRAVLECASLLAQPIPLDLLAAPPFCAYLGLSQRALLSLAVTIADQGTLLTWDGEDSIRFASSSLRQVLRERTHPSVIRRDHLNCAQALYAIDGESRPALLAAHYLAGGDYQQALNFAVLSAQELARSAAYPEALQSYQLALEALERFSEPDEQMKYDILRAMSVAAEQANDWTTALTRLKEALALSQGDSARQAELYASIGWLRFQRGELQAAAESLNRSAGLYRSFDDVRGQAQIDYYLGMLYGQQKEWQRAVACFERYLDVSEKEGFSEGRASAYVELGNLHRLQYEWVQAEDLLQKGIVLAQAENDYQVLAQGYHYLGLCYAYQGKPESIDMLQRALDIVHTRTKQPVQEARLQNTLAETLVRQNRWVEAEDAFRASARLKERLGDKAGLAITYGGLGRMYSRQWRFDQAAEYLQKDIDLLAEEFEANVAWIQQWTNLIGEVRRLQGRFDLAERQFTEALSLAERIPDASVRERSLGFVHMFRANLALDRGNLSLAARECDQARAALAGTWAEGDLERTLARLARLSGDLAAAGQHLERALAAAERGEDIDRALTLLERARLCRDLGDEAAARSAVEQVIVLAGRLQNVELERRAQAQLALIPDQTKDRS